MQVLEFINTYIKYVYIALAIVFIIVLIKLFKQLSNISKTVDPIMDSADNIHKCLDELDEKTKIIDHTMKTSVPFFTNIIVGVTLIGSILKDYHETKNSKRSLKKSFSKIYKYKKKIDPSFSLSKLGQSILSNTNR